MILILVISMHDIKQIKSDPSWFDNGLIKRGLPPLSKYIIEMDNIKCSVIQVLEHYQSESKKLSKEFAINKKNGIDTSEMEKISKKYKEIIRLYEKEKLDVEQELKNMLDHIPNIPTEDVPFDMNRV